MNRLLKTFLIIALGLFLSSCSSTKDKGPSSPMSQTIMESDEMGMMGIPLKCEAKGPQGMNDSRFVFCEKGMDSSGKEILLNCRKTDVCEYFGNFYLYGEKFPAQDGCNTCTCHPGGNYSCTEMFCDPNP